MDIKANVHRALEFLFGVHRIDWINGSVAVGSNRATPATLRRRGLTAVLSVGSRLRDYGGLEANYLSVTDKQAPTLSDVLNAIKWIDSMSLSGKKVFIHCRAGMGRSVTVAACYLIAKENLDPEQALKIIRAAHPQSSPTSRQREFVYSFSRHLDSPHMMVHET